MGFALLTSLAAALPPHQSRQAAPPPDAIAQFIAALEAQYSAALQLYRQGQLDEARQGFDATLDQLLASSYNIRAQPRLQHELDSLLDRIQALESDLLANGGLSQAQPQATPLERIPELTFPLDAATRAAIERESRSALAPPPGRGPQPATPQLPLELNDAVERYIHYFTTSGRADLVNGLRRAGRYRAMVDRIFLAQGVPTDLIYLAQLESDFDPRLVSRAGAHGMWQFMASRASDYGLKRTTWVDDRFDPEKATTAAARHLKDLYHEFGDWYLAMAAYNAGPANIQKIVARTGYADYFKLYDMGALPKYLRNYVPVILAFALIAKSPQQYGVDELVPADPDQVAVEHLSAALDLRLAAECVRASVADLQRLNPSLLHLRAPANFDLRLPQDSDTRFQRGLAQVPPADRMSWRLHWVAPGETWGGLSRRFHISVARLASANHLSPARAPAVGAPLALPLGAAASAHAATPRARAAKKG
ncbi:MAG: transglycosylase SLT domain-containing protein [Terriglobales bacterium]